MAIFLLIAQYLPLIMSVVTSIEQSINAPGQLKAQIALNTIQTAAQAAGKSIPESHVQFITKMIDNVVEIFNKSGIFVKDGSAAKSG